MIEMEPERLAKQALTLLLILNVLITGYPSYLVIEACKDQDL